MKGKWLRVLLAVLVLWIGVSCYFYTQHKRMVKEYDFNKTVNVGDTRVIFKQICFTQYSPKTQVEYKIPWYYNVLARLPIKIQLPFVKVCSFYTRPYQVNPDGILKVKGIIIFPKPYEGDEIPLDKSIDIDLYDDEDNYTLNGNRLEWGSNLCLFSIHSDHVPYALERVRAVVTDRETGEVKSLVIRPDWDTKIYHGNLLPEFPFSPKETIRQMVMNISKQGIDNNNLQPVVLSTARSRFPWQNLQHHYWHYGYRTEMAYQKNYKGYQDVYSIQLMFISNLANADKIVASQKFYLVELKNEWKIIDVSKVENIKGQKQTSQAIKAANDSAAAAKLFAQLEAAEQFVKSQDYSIMMDSAANFDLQLPDLFKWINSDVQIDDLLKKRNEISKQNGLDFSSYLGKQVTLITYGVKNEKNVGENIDLILDGKNIVGF